MCACPDDHAAFAREGANLINSWFDRGVQAAENDMVALEYFELYLAQSVAKSRGFPNERGFDPELMYRASKIARGTQMLQEPAGQRIPQPTSPGATSGGVVPQEVQLAELMAAVKSIQTTQTSLMAASEAGTRRFDGLNLKFERLEERCKNKGSPTGNPDKNMTCNICGEKGHRAANCPNKPDE